MHTEAQAQALVHTTSTLLYFQGYSLGSIKLLEAQIVGDCDVKLR